LYPALFREYTSTLSSLLNRLPWTRISVFGIGSFLIRSWAVTLIQKKDAYRPLYGLLSVVN
jgi:hypothetical protein